MASLSDILQTVTDNHPEAPIELIKQAYAHAARAQSVSGEESEGRSLAHRVAVADSLAGMRLDGAAVCSALLHGVVESGALDMAEIQQEFGSAVAFLVDGVRRLDQFSFTPHEGEDEQAESFRKMLLAVSSDIRVVLVKLVERLDTMRTLESPDTGMQQRIAKETLEIYAPLAERLGMQGVKAELQNLGFRHLEPEAFHALDAKVETVKQSTDRYMTEMTARIKKLMVNKD